MSKVNNDNGIGPTSQLPKERLAFVSGNVLLFALLSAKLWPAISAYQTKLNLHAWTTNTPGQGVKPEYWIFWFGTLILAIMSAALVLALFHIMCWGIWLGISGELVETTEAGVFKPQTRAEELLRKLSERSYGAVFCLCVFLGMMIVMTGLSLLTVGIEELLTMRLHLSARASGWIARIMMILFFLGVSHLVVWIFWKRFLKRRPGTDIPAYVRTSSAFTLWSFYLALLVFMPLWMTVTEFCYTLDVKLNKQLFSLKAAETLEIYVSLGGGTSSPGDADVRLLDPSGAIVRKLSLDDLGDGQFVSHVSTTELLPGRYEVSLDYPHTSLKQTFPYVSSQSHRMQRFVIIP